MGLQWDRQPRRAGFSRSFLKLRAGVLFGQLEADRGPTQAPLLRFEAAPARFRSYISSGRAVGAHGRTIPLAVNRQPIAVMHNTIPAQRYAKVRSNSRSASAACVR